ncbi:GGDEF domain protein [Shewanella piezotolerans WP3]|uniref:GGDEF domain protein n=1 Tax=Shewanella piezotolerans (strain WP3 / JCM 13877) TaxID=225849 RepID=B8CU52_SHEPW|nr:GGDEF domain-containing protein [Shewanella piezotolerans]ACJ30908.1 GGDEF domain protein [Shewanella piezotolerans WP3]
MLAQNIDHNVWLRDQEQPAVSLPRWQQQVDLLNDLYRAKTCLVMQFSGQDAQIVCGKKHHDSALKAGKVLTNSPLLTAINSISSFGSSELTIDELGDAFAEFEQVLSIQLSWPDGRVFGCILICDPNTTQATSASLTVIESVRSLLQSELKQVYLMQQVQRLSFQDETTQMLNHYGFGLMAPRQLSLSRRFGSHAGIVLIELVDNPLMRTAPLSTAQKARLLARIIAESLREADMSARIDEDRFMILAFVDSESNLDTLIGRLRKQIAKEAGKLSILVGKSFFTPDAQQSLVPMQQAAEDNLELCRQSLVTKPY